MKDKIESVYESLFAAAGANGKSAKYHYDKCCDEVRHTWTRLSNYTKEKGMEISKKKATKAKIRETVN